MAEADLEIFQLLANLIAFELEADETERRSRAVGRQIALQARELARLDERERIAMDLHDGVIQSLYSIVLGLGAQQMSIVADQREAELAQTITRLNDVIHEIRNNIVFLRGPELESTSLSDGIELLADQVRATAGVAVDVDVDSATERSMDSGTRRTLLFIAREATSNVVRHAGATRVSIGVRGSAEHVLMTIRDDGRGIDRNGLAARAGNGLRNIAERASAAGGRSTIHSRPGMGTEIQIRVPSGWTPT